MLRSGSNLIIFNSIEVGILLGINVYKQHKIIWTMSDKKLMLITAFVSILCVTWALFVPSLGMAVALLLNAIFAAYSAFKLDKKTS